MHTKEELMGMIATEACEQIAIIDPYLQECELCHDKFPIRDVEMTDSGQILCKKCRMAAMPNVES